MTVRSGQWNWTAINVRYSSFEMPSTSMKLAFMFPASLTFAFHFVNLNF